MHFYEILMDQLKFISLFGNFVPAVLLSFLIVLAFLISRKQYKTTIIMIFTLFSYVYSIILKGIFRLDRPLGAEPTHFFTLDKYSFPSSHVIFYTVFWGFVVYLSYKYIKEAKLILHTTRWLAAYYIVSIGASRIALGMHFLRDVVAGYIFGLIFLVFLIWMDKTLNDEKLLKLKKKMNKKFTKD